MKALILFWLLLCWLLSTLLVWSITGCKTEPDCEEVDCTECWESWWVYDPILNRWLQTYRPCEEEPVEGRLPCIKLPNGKLIC